MDRYVIEKIKKNKIENDASSDVLIHEYHSYTFENIEYIDIYVYLKKAVSNIKINDMKAININVIEVDKIMCLTYLSKDVRDKLLVTEYMLGKKVVKVKNDNLVNYEDYNFNDEDLFLLKKMSLDGIKKIEVIPSLKDNYWICFCGEVNTGLKCNHCGCLKEYARYYDSGKKIHQSYARSLFMKHKFISDNIDEEINDFRRSLMNDGVVNLNYLDNEFYDSLSDVCSVKKDNFLIMVNNFKCIIRNILIVLIMLFLLGFIILLLDNKKNKESIDEMISSYCYNTDDNNFVKYDLIDDVINNYSCGSFVWYIMNNQLDDYDIRMIINSDNIELYELYYDVNKELLHNMLDDKNINNVFYLKYLADNNYSVPSDMLVNVLEILINVGNVELFDYFSKGFNNLDYYWIMDEYYFNYNPKLSVVKEKYGKDNILELAKILSYDKFTLLLHKNGFSNKCYTADYGNVENLRYLSLIDSKSCDKVFFDIVDLVDSSYITKHYNAFGKISYNSYNGTYFHKLTYENNTLVEFEKKIKLLKKYGLNINTLSNTSSYLNEKTPLDKFMEDNERLCYYSNAEGAKKFDDVRAYYKVLKKYGAVCKRNCNLERYYK